MDATGYHAIFDAELPVRTVRFTPMSGGIHLSACAANGRIGPRSDRPPAPTGKPITTRTGRDTLTAIEPADRDTHRRRSVRPPGPQARSVTKSRSAPLPGAARPDGSRAFRGRGRFDVSSATVREVPFMLLPDEGFRLPLWLRVVAGAVVGLALNGRLTQVALSLLAGAAVGALAMWLVQRRRSRPGQCPSCVVHLDARPRRGHATIRFQDTLHRFGPRANPVPTAARPTPPTVPRPSVRPMRWKRQPKF